MSKKLSGAEYRKRKKEKDEAEQSLLKNVKKVSAYFKSAQSSSSVTKDSEEPAEGTASSPSVLLTENPTTSNEEVSYYS